MLDAQKLAMMFVMMMLLATLMGSSLPVSSVLDKLMKSMNFWISSIENGVTAIPLMLVRFSARKVKRHP
jgi:hypothetical protein